jgi:hypothetical protein
MRKKLTETRRRRPVERLVRRCSEERILQLANDVSEGIASGDVKEWRAVALYFRQQLDLAERRIREFQPSISALCTGTKLMGAGIAELQAWLDRHYPPNHRLG